MAISVWQEKAERARAALANLREASKSVVPRVIHSSESVVAGGAAGAIRGAFEATGKKYAIPGPGGTSIAPELIGGGLAVAVGFSGQTEVSDDLIAIGTGILSYSAGREAENWMRTRAQKPAAPPGAAQ